MCELKLLNSVVHHESIHQQLNLRRNKLNTLQKQGNAFPNHFKRNIISNQLHTKYGDKQNKILKMLNIQVSLAGRMITRRMMGKVSFVTLQDSGGKIQLYLSSKDLSDSFYNEHFKTWDLGDILGVHGTLFKTKTGELTIHCNKIILLTKALRPMPDKFHGIVDKTIRYRQRYLDLITNNYSLNIFKLRSQIIAAIRQFLINKDFIEVETPILQTIPGGATARPFVTYHHALDMNMYLRIAPELYLKQLIIGGFERIFEINRNFRNEGLSTYHNPEFTMMELYMAYADYSDAMLLIQKLLNKITNDILGTNIIQYGNLQLDFSKKFLTMTMKEAICFYNKNILSHYLDDKIKAITIANSMDIKIDQNWGLGKIQTEIFEKTTEKYLLQPTFITSYPVEVSPLARRNDNNPFFTDRFELFIGGYEIGNGFSELNDSEDQANRFIEQAKMKNNGDYQAMFYDKDYILALEYGLPPTAGLGIGIDRLIMLLTNSHSIRDVILFPTMRPKI